MDPTAPITPAPAPVDPAPAADPTPAPEAPAVEPSAPETPPAPVEPEKTPEQVAQEAEDKEWDDAADELFPGIKSKNKEQKKDEPAEPKKDPEKPEAGEENPKDKEPDAEPKPGDDTGTENEDNQPNEQGDAARDARIANRQAAQQIEAVKSDVKAKMYADLPDTLQDADGDPIESIEDVQKLINPRTDELFTEEEAGMWLLSAQQQFNQKKADIEKKIETIAEVNLDVKDQADAVNAKYGAILKADTTLRDELWAEFEQSLERDPETGIITKTTISLEKFYDRALGHRLAENKAPAAPAVPEQTPEQKAEAEAKAKVEADAKRQQQRHARSDIYAPNNEPPIDDDDKEWGEAAKAVFPDQFK